MKTTLGSNIAVQEGGDDQLDCLLVGDEQLEGDCLVEDGQLRGNLVFSSCKIIA